METRILPIEWTRNHPHLSEARWCHGPPDQRKCSRPQLV